MDWASIGMAVIPIVAQAQAEEDRILGTQCRMALRREMSDLERSGYITSFEVLTRTERPGSSVLNVTLQDGIVLHYDITDDEIRMGGFDCVRSFLYHVRRDVIDRREASPRQTATEISSRLYQTFLEMAQFDRDFFAFNIEQTRTLADRLGLAGIIRKTNAKADQKAKDLFVSVAGRVAFDRLESGQKWPVDGSAGGKYWLLKKSTFCIERRVDGANFCAVVPGVPLYDHLLGIKLMVEHDEPRFLKTANVAGAFGPFVPGGITWVDPTRDDATIYAARDRILQEAIREAADQIINPPIYLGIDPARPDRQYISSGVDDPTRWEL